MNLINTIIVDDEQHNINVLKALLLKHCPLIRIVAECNNADSAYEKIVADKPQLVLLDIRMPNKSGFDLLKLFKKIDFEVIFVSAFNEYAITAFDFNAIGYILKPIDYTKLIMSIDKAINKIESKRTNENVFNFIQTVDDQNDKINKILIHHKDKVVFVKIEDIVIVESKIDVCELKLVDNLLYHSSKGIKQFEDLLILNSTFIRINKSVIINISYIKAYSKGETCFLEMVNGLSYEVSRRKKTEVLNKIDFLKF
jgi:two-component system, LytTR family, response regulator